MWVNFTIHGKITYKEDLVDRLENAIDAFIGQLIGENFGKLIIQVGPLAL